ncbi:MAG TPA: hypothetical protein VNA19_06260 [Pyrinomonadaceae bacterium]|jgi:hypothetical protein|nr:hypothetical protein [Pyrinomonadaceae bacterium]
MPTRKSSKGSKKASRSGGGGGKGGGGGSRNVSPDAVQKILRQARPQEDTGQATRGMTRGGVATAIPDFCKNYRATIRPILMAIIGMLKIFKKQWAETLAQVVAFLDMVCGGE